MPIANVSTETQPEAAVTILNSGVVIDKSKLMQCSDEKATALMAAAYDTGKPVVMIGNAGVFFTSKTLIGELESPTNDLYWRLIAEKCEIRIEPADIAIIARAVEIRKEIQTKLKPAYAFASVPPAFDFDQAFKLTNGNMSIKRTHGDYQISLKQIRNLWGVASRKWAKMSQQGTCAINTGGYHGSKTANIYEDHIQLGCQRIERYELEQCAVKHGWDFP